MADDTVYLPNTHGSIPTAIKIDGDCYEYKRQWLNKKETMCWHDVDDEFSTLKDCCYPNVRFVTCPPSAS